MNDPHASRCATALFERVTVADGDLNNLRAMAPLTAIARVPPWSGDLSRLRTIAKGRPPA